MKGKFPTMYWLHQLQTRDLHLSRNTLYLLSSSLCFFKVLKRDLFVFLDNIIDELDGYHANRTPN